MQWDTIGWPALTCAGVTGANGLQWIPRRLRACWRSRWGRVFFFKHLNLNPVSVQCIQPKLWIQLVHMQVVYMETVSPWWGTLIGWVLCLEYIVPIWFWLQNLKQFPGLKRMQVFVLFPAKRAKRDVFPCLVSGISHLARLFQRLFPSQSPT